MDLSQIIEQDSTNGVIRFRQTGVRANIISSKAWASMKVKMFESFGSGAASILFGLGQFYGSEAGSTYVGRLQQPFDVFRYAADFGLATGWGKISSEISSEALGVKVENCCFCEGIKMDQPICYEFAGIISATLSGIAKEEIMVKETQCIAKGDSSCRFEARMPKSLREGFRSRK